VIDYAFGVIVRARCGQSPSLDERRRRARTRRATTGKPSQKRGVWLTADSIGTLWLVEQQESGTPFKINKIRSRGTSCSVRMAVGRSRVHLGSIARPAVTALTIRL
jgi:hypothetical protein